MNAKNKVLVLMSFSLTTSLCFGQVEFLSEWGGQDLKGQVKSIKTTIYYADEKFGEISKGDVYSWKSYQFDSKGECIENTNSDESYLKYENKYNNQNKLIEKNFYHLDGTLIGKRVNKYNNEEIAQTIIYGEDGSLSDKYLYKYNDNTKNCETIEYNNNGILICKWLHDKNRNLLEIYEYSDSDGSLNTRQKYEYDSNGKLNRALVYDIYDKLQKEYSYNENADAIMEKSYSYSYDDDYNDVATPTIEYTYQYKYDNKKNWIERIAFKSEAEIVISIQAREIEYYK